MQKKTITLSIVVILILLGAAGFRLGYFKKAPAPAKENAALTGNEAEEEDSDDVQLLIPEGDSYAFGRQILGSWRQEHPESSVCPQDAFEVRFSIEESGKLLYDSWLHCRPLESGSWSLDEDTITIKVGGFKDSDKVYIENNDTFWFGRKGEFKRVVDEFSEVGPLISLWDKFFAPSAVKFEEAKRIAQSDCAKEGKILGSWFYNQNTKTWWFDTDIQKQGCSPACVVSEQTKTAEINWRCTGLISP